MLVLDINNTSSKIKTHYNYDAHILEALINVNTIIYQLKIYIIKNI